MAWFDELKTPGIKTDARERKSTVPEGLWVKCDACGEILQSRVLKENFRVCSECQHHFRMAADERIDALTDPGSFKEYASGLASSDPLEFFDQKPYKERLLASAKSTNLTDALVAGKATLEGLPFHLGVFEFRFMGGSMGIVVGEKVALVLENALKEKVPAVLVCASGGARMQEGILSLMQMAKASALVSDLRCAGVPFITVLTDPTTGGVAASFAMQGDVIIAEPKALIGFAGPRVIQQTIRQSLPPGFQRSEFLLAHGLVDRVVHRRDLRGELHTWLSRLGHAHCFTKKKARRS